MGRRPKIHQARRAARRDLLVDAPLLAIPVFIDMGGSPDLIFVEQAVAAARGLVEQLKQLGGAGKAQVVEMGAARYLRSPPQAFDIVFLDPPFGRGALAEYVPMLEAGEWLKQGAMVYLENEKSEGVPKLPPRWELLKSKSAGEVGYHLARVNARA